MKIAFFSHYERLYGANKSLLCLIDSLRLYGVEAFVILPGEGDMTSALEERDVEYACVPMEWWVHDSVERGDHIQFLYRLLKSKYYVIRRTLKNFCHLKAIIFELSKWNVDLIYTNSSILYCGALAALRLDLPHIWHIREFIDLDYNLEPDFGKSLHDFLIGLSGAKIAVSQAICKHFSGKGGANNFHVVYNGAVPDRKFLELKELASNRSLNDESFVFSIVGCLHKAKCQSEAIEALSYLKTEFPKIRLLIVGDGPADEMNRLKHLAQEKGVESNVDFLGFVEDPYKAYLSSNVLLMCSRNEGMGRVTVEAMSACCPVIGYDNAGTSELIEHGKTGFLYRQGSEELAQYMKKFVQEPALVQEMGLEAWQVARNRFSNEAYAEGVYNVIQSMLEKHHLVRKVISNRT